MRNRRNNNIKNVKDYIVPIVTFGLIFILIYLAFSWDDSNETDIGTTTNINSVSNPNQLTIRLDDSDTKVTLIDEDEKKTVISDWDWINPGQSVIVEKGSMSFSIPDEADFSLNKNWELKYEKNSKMSLLSSALWVKSENDIEVDMKFGNVQIGKDSVVNIEQNEVSSTVYLLKWSAEVENLSWVSTFLSQWKRIEISNKNASNEDLDMVALKEDFDDYFKISDWYLQNGWTNALSDTSSSVDISDDSDSDSLFWDDTDSSLWENIEAKKPLITSQLLSFDNITDEWSVQTPSTTITWTFTNDSIAWIIIQGKTASINIENN